MSETSTLELSRVAWPGADARSAPTLSAQSSAQRVGLVGAWTPLFRALTHQAPFASGSATVLGCPFEAALARGVVGFAPCDPALPAAFTVSEYLRHAARLTHGSPSRAAHEVRQTLERLQLGALAPRTLSRLAPFERRALGIAAAALTNPAVICLESPLRGLDAPAADYVADLCLEAARHSRLLVSSERPSTPSAERTLLDQCDDLLVLDDDGRLTRGTPEAIFAPSGRYLMTVKGSAIPAFAAALGAAHCRLAPGHAPGSYAIELPGDSTTDLLLDTALSHDLIVLELTPLFGSA